jgi:hypothetical protein
MKEDTLHNATKYGVILALLLGLVLPGSVLGQATGKVSVEGRGGVAFPVGDMLDITDIGGTFGVLLSPPMDLLFFGGSIEVNFNAPKYQNLPFTFTANVGAGMMQMDVDETYDLGHPAAGFDKSYPAFQGGAKIGYQIKDWINVFVNGTAYFILMDSNDTLVFVNPDAGVTNFNTGWVIPVTAGVRLTFLR